MSHWCSSAVEGYRPELPSHLTEPECNQRDKGIFRCQTDFEKRFTP